MNLFEEIAGFKGENLISAIFRVLLIRSEEVRSSFLDLISEKSGSFSITLNSHFSCVLEQPTYDEKLTTTGRIDLMIETDDAVIGIENKLFAGFQSGQPNKYLEAIRERAQNLGGLRNIRYSHCVVVIAPKSREREIQAHINGNDLLIFLPWDDVLERIQSRRACLDEQTAVMMEIFNDFVSKRLGFMRDFSKWAPHLQGNWQPSGTELQRGVVAELKDIVSQDGTGVSKATNYIGYYLACGRPGQSVWLGFVLSSTEIVSPPDNHCAELVIVSSFSMQLTGDDYRQITIRNGFLRTETLYAWAIKYDKSWANSDRWRVAFEPLIRQLQVGQETNDNHIQGVI